MIGQIHIRNFKSIRELKFDTKRVNIFVGEPNTGKSNILEALAFFSQGVLISAAQELLRFKTTADLFFDQKVANELSVNAEPWRLSLKFGNSGDFQGTFFEAGKTRGSFRMQHQGEIHSAQQPQTTIRYYNFKPLRAFPNRLPGTLNPPFGDNLAAILYTNESLRQKIGSLVRAKGFRLQLKPAEHELLIAKDVGEELYSYPWTSVSETLRRVAFFMAALETNRGSTLLLDEPEANTFPFYTKYLAEQIALDESNQFFITTHNPYLLASVVEKTPQDKLAVFVTRMEKFETNVKQIPEQKLAELLELDSDAFFNLDRLVDE